MSAEPTEPEAGGGPPGARAHPGHWAGVATAALTATVTVMPGFAVGALAPAIEADLGVSGTAVGLAMSGFYAATALGSPLATRAAARLPVPVAFAAAVLVAAAALLVVARANGAAVLAAALVAAGLGNGLVQPAAGRLIAARTPANRRSLAAGVVGAALAAATLVPGLLVAVVLPAHGWRTAMLVAAAIALAPVVLAPLARAGRAERPEQPERPVRPVRHERPASTARPSTARGAGGVLALWALAAALSATGNNAVATYFVGLGTDAGLPAGAAGRLLALSAVLAIAVRLAAGALTDRAPHRNPAVIAAMMLLGGFGLALVATGSPAAFVVGAVLAFSAGWGWTGLLLATALRLVPGRAEKAGHTVQVGIYTGATVAPFAFAALSGALGSAGAALTAAAAGLAGAAVTAAGALLLRRRAE